MATVICFTYYVSAETYGTLHLCFILGSLGSKYIDKNDRYLEQNRDYFYYFPKGSFYPNQEKAMDTIYDVLLKNKFVLFEGACGTGKTLSAFAPAPLRF